MVKSQMPTIPDTYFRESFGTLVQKAKIVLSHAYMVQQLVAETDTIPGWEGFPVKLYAFQTGNDLYTGRPKTGKVYLLNPSPEKLATWVANACWVAKYSVDTVYTYR